VKRFSDLLRVYTEIQGIPFRELAETLGYDITKDPKSMKSAAGDIAEMVAGKKPDSLPQADLTQFDIEVKTVPLDLLGYPRENTKITAVNYSSLLTEEWAMSHVYEKVRVVLFVPIVKEDTRRPDSWYVRSPFIWMPSHDQLAVIREDWETIQGMVQSGGQLTAKVGQYLIANTSGQGKGRDDRTYQLADGRTIPVKTRAFFLRKTSVAEILQANIRFRP
jgi:DNA mismatch repair protein MutH